MDLPTRGLGYEHFDLIMTDTHLQLFYISYWSNLGRRDSCILWNQNSQYIFVC